MKFQKLRFFILFTFLFGCEDRSTIQLIQDAPLISLEILDSDGLTHRLKPNSKVLIWNDHLIEMAEVLETQNPNIFVNPAYQSPSLNPFVSVDELYKEKYFVVLDPEETDFQMLNIFKKYAQIISLKTNHLNDIPKNLKIIGKVIQNEKVANQIADSLSLIMSKIEKTTGGQIAYKSMLLLDVNPVTVAGEGSYLHEMLQIAGGSNAFDFVETSIDTIDMETLWKLQPEFLFIISDDNQIFQRFLAYHPAVADLPAIVNKAAFQLKPANFLTSGLHVFDGLVELTRCLHPSLPIDSLIQSSQKPN